MLHKFVFALLVLVAVALAIGGFMLTVAPLSFGFGSLWWTIPAGIVVMAAAFGFVLPWWMLE